MLWASFPVFPESTIVLISLYRFGAVTEEFEVRDAIAGVFLSIPMVGALA